MTEYGHDAMRGKLGGYAVYMDSWGAGPYVLTAGGKVFYFEDSQRFGPQRLTVKGTAYGDMGLFPNKSPFWTVWRRWVKEGRQTTKGKKKGFLYCVVSNGRKKCKPS